MHKLTSVLTIATVAIVVAACGSSSSSSSSSAAASPSTSSASSSPAASSSSSAAASSAPAASSQVIKLAASPTGMLMYNTKKLSAKAGKVTIEFTNTSSLPHNVTVQKGTNGAVVGATPTFAGGTKSLTLTLKPGTYTYYCSVPGHRQAGMQGTLTIR